MTTDCDLCPRRCGVDRRVTRAEVAQAKQIARAAGLRLL